jgi:hypothetical protein
MLLDALWLTLPVPAAVVETAQASGSGAMCYGSQEELLGGTRARWSFATRDGRVVSIGLFAAGTFEELASLYDDLAARLRARHGQPSDAPANDDEQRNVPLYEEGLPDDRYWRLRSIAWRSSDAAASLSLCVTWPANLELRLSAESKQPGG